jgi:hypothetical protein
LRFFLTDILLFLWVVHAGGGHCAFARVSLEFKHIGGPLVGDSSDVQAWRRQNKSWTQTREIQKVKRLLSLQLSFVYNTELHKTGHSNTRIIQLPEELMSSFLKG